MCLSLSFPGVEDTFKIFQFRVFESAVVGTSDARKNAATKVRRQQRARARREESDERRHRVVKVVKAGMAKSARSKASFEREREKKTKRSVFPFYSSTICTSRYY